MMCHGVFALNAFPSTRETPCEVSIVKGDGQKQVIDNFPYRVIVGYVANDFVKLLAVHLDQQFFILTQGSLRGRLGFEVVSEASTMMTFWNRKARIIHNEETRTADAAYERSLGSGNVSEDL